MWCPVLGALLVIATFPGHARVAITPRYDCDHNHDKFMREGNQGSVGMFPWLGIIRVTLSEGSKQRIAVTGAVLIRVTHAIADAEDIVKIPKRILREHTKAMFISADQSPWLYAIKGYHEPPDFRTRTMRSIALVELELKDDPSPLKPICWQDRNYHLSHKHFAVGYTDERYILEKIAYNMQFINKTQCEMYYENIDMNANNNLPVHYQCWAAMKNTRNCMWENGMVLVSNYTGTWFLIGLGIRGPGCSLPVRFVSVLNYVEWIESVINEAFMRIKSPRLTPRIKDVPAHTLYASELDKSIDNDEIREFDGILFRRAYNPPRTDGVADRRSLGNIILEENAPYREEHWKMDDIRHMDPNVLKFEKFGDKYERTKGDCSNAGHLVYKEITEITQTSNLVGYAYYKMSIIDLEEYQYTCVVIRVISRSRSDCNLWYSLAKAVDEPLMDASDTPWHIMKHFIPAGERITRIPFQENVFLWKPHDALEPVFKREEGYYWGRWSYNNTQLNLYLKFDVVENGQLVLEVWAPSSIGIYGPLTTPRSPDKRSMTRTRRQWHTFTRNTTTRATTTKPKPKRRRTTRTWTRPTTKKNKRTRRPTKRPRPRATAIPFYNVSLRTSEDEFNNSRMRKAVITLLDNLPAKSASNSSDYVLCLILILFISTFR